MTRYDEVKADLQANPKTWLITGVAGFIGSNLLETLLKLNQTVVGLDNFATGYQHNLDEVQTLVTEQQWTRFRFIEGDIRNLEDCREAVKGTDYVLHQAALGSVPRSIEDPIATNQANIDGFLNMLVAAKVGQYKRLNNAIADSLDLKLDTCTLEDLSNVSGAGPKTCRFFLLHTRKGCNYVVLDRHILGWLRFHGIEDAPRNTPPPGKQYEKYARIAEYLLPCAFPGMTMAQIDLLVWSLQSGRIQDPYELSNRKEFDALP